MQAYIVISQSKTGQTETTTDYKISGENLDKAILDFFAVYSNFLAVNGIQMKNTVGCAQW